MQKLIEALIPRPQRVEVFGGQFDWTVATTLILESGNSADGHAAETLLEACREAGLPTPRIVYSDTADLPPNGNCILAGDPGRHLPLAALLRREGITTVPEELADDGYVLEITPERILLYGNTPAGVYYGFQTLIQLLRAAPAGRLPALRIVDWTDLKHRGISMDFGRGEVYTVDAAKRDIRLMAHYKMNLLVIYFEDAFLFPSHPDIGEGRDRLTTAEALDLCAFARQHHVEIIPFYDSPGHMERTLALPRYAHLAEGAESEALRSVIDVTNPETYELLHDLYTDLGNAFPGRYLHIGGDEAFVLGKGRSKSLADVVGVERLYVRHLKRLRDILAANGKRMVVAADPFEPGFFDFVNGTNYGLDPLMQLPRDIILQPWHYGPTEAFPFGDQAKGLGFEMHLWSSMEAHHGFFPLMENSMEDVESFIPFAHRLRALGTVHSNWGDRIPYFRETNWPGIVHYSEWAWREDGREGNELLPKAVESLYGPSTGDLEKTLRFLCNVDRYFPWGVGGLQHAFAPLFFDERAPHELDAKQLDILEAFRRDGREARAVFERVCAMAAHNQEDLEFVEFALDQAETLADLVECRHYLASKESASRARADGLLDWLAATMTGLLTRYEVLWHRARRPLGIRSNKALFEAVIAWVAETRSTRT